MRLLDTYTGLFRWFNNSSDASYAILSHVWDRDEMTLQELSRIHQEISDVDLKANPNAILDRLPPKIKNFCKYAREQGYAFGWADTCCIDKTNSAELSEAINSMYAWYQQASVCYAYLVDVDDHGYLPLSPNLHHHTQFQGYQQLMQSRWFQRGWTLQELIAPRVVLFLSRGWGLLGTKAGLGDVITEITTIERSILSHAKPVTEVSVALRMSWATSRITTRIEDQAYSLMGIFGVNMPTIYGEGRQAFVRLQEEIMKHVPDQSIFAWGLRLLPPHPPTQYGMEDISQLMPFSPSHHSQTQLPPPPSAPDVGCLLALSTQDYLQTPSPSVKAFPISHVEFGRLLGREVPLPAYTTTPYGIQVTMPIFPIRMSSLTEHEQVFLAILACVDEENRLLALILSRPANHQSTVLYVAARHPATFVQYRLVALSQIQLSCLRVTLRIQDVCILRRVPQSSLSRPEYTPLVAMYTDQLTTALQLAPWCHDALAGEGYIVTCLPVTDEISDDLQTRLKFDIEWNGVRVHVRMGHCLASPCNAAQMGDIVLRASISYTIDSRSADDNSSPQPLKVAKPLHRPSHHSDSLQSPHPHSPHISDWDTVSSMTAAMTFVLPVEEEIKYLRLTVRRRAAYTLSLVVEAEIVDARMLELPSS